MDCGAFVTWAMVNGGVLEEGESVGPQTNRFTNDIITTRKRARQKFNARFFSLPDANFSMLRSYVQKEVQSQWKKLSRPMKRCSSLTAP